MLGLKINIWPSLNCSNVENDESNRNDNEFDMKRLTKNKTEYVYSCNLCGDVHMEDEYTNICNLYDDRYSYNDMK